MNSRRYVYFIKPIGMEGPIKIGCSDAPLKRLADLAAWSPWPLEVIGSVPGGLKDEGFIHGCFKDSHSHHEWFRSSQKLRDAIAMILQAGSLAPVSDKMEFKGSIRSKLRRPRTESERKCFSYACKIRHWERRNYIRNDDEVISHTAPRSVKEIVDKWSGNSYRKIPGIQPTADEIAALDAFLADPMAQCERRTIPRLKPKEAA